jgi:hypothetical protein
MALQLRNVYGQIDIAAIDPAAVAELSDAAQIKLAALIDAVTAHDAAKERFAKAKSSLVAAEKQQAFALAAHQTASDPFPFNPPDPARYGSKAEYDAAVSEKRRMHDQAVRETLSLREHRRAVAAYVPSN